MSYFSKIVMTSKQFNYELKIPLDRVAVLIGKKGDIKQDIEKSTKTIISIDSKEGDVSISGEDALGLFTVREIIKAIARGFNPEIAKLLLKQDFILEIIDLKEYAGKNKSTSLRLKGRVIGKEGKSRRVIEDLTECYISVYGKTIAIIGKVDFVNNARMAVESLLRGAPHGNVYKALERKRKELRQKAFLEKGDVNGQ